MYKRRPLLCSYCKFHKKYFTKKKLSNILFLNNLSFFMRINCLPLILYTLRVIYNFSHRKL